MEKFDRTHKNLQNLNISVVGILQLGIAGNTHGQISKGTEKSVSQAGGPSEKKHTTRKA